MSLPPTDLNLFLHVKRAHLQMLLWKAADQLGPPDVSITEYGWEIQDGLICPSIYSGPPGPPLLMNVISCRCRAKGKAFKETNCSCHRVKLSCTMYCFCTAGDACHNPFTKKEDEMEDAAPNNYDHEHDNDRDEQDEDEDDQMDDWWLMSEPGSKLRNYIFEIARFAIMQAYVHALRAWGLFNYMLHKYDLFITVVCSVILIYLHCANVKCFR